MTKKRSLEEQWAEGRRVADRLEALWGQQIGRDEAELRAAVPGVAPAPPKSPPPGVAAGELELTGEAPPGATRETAPSRAPRGLGALLAAEAEDVPAVSEEPVHLEEEGETRTLVLATELEEARAELINAREENETLDARRQALEEELETLGAAYHDAISLVEDLSRVDPYMTRTEFLVELVSVAKKLVPDDEKENEDE